MQEYLNQLNTAQKDAVTNINGPSLVIAGAGSGKTRVLTYRIVHLLNSGVPAHKILSLTFTNKAAKEMKDRISTIIGWEKAKNLWMGTFHSIFAKILRIEAESLGFPTNFTIYDSIDTKSVLKSIIKDLKLDDQIYKPGDVYGRISKAKNNLVTAQAYADNAQARMADDNSKRPEIYRIYQIYTEKCFRSGSMDFDDLLLKTNILFRDFPEILKKYQQKFSHVLVDEYQDTNFSQYLIIKKLVEKHHNICVVGDDAQSIYSFRGAKIENILNFQKDYTDFKLFKLEQNYRSTKNIVDAANSVIEKNKERIKKDVYSENEEGDKIAILDALTDHEEGFLVINKIFDSIYTDHTEYKDHAILYRTNAQSRIFEETLRKRNIPYKIYGGTSFYQRKEIKDVLAYFKLTVNKKDDEAVKRVLNYPKRGIGQTTIDTLENYAKDSGLSMWDAIMNIPQSKIDLNARAVNQIFGFANMIETFTSKLYTTDAYDLAKEIASVSGILKELFLDKAPENVARHENVQELLNGIKEFCNQNEIDGQFTTLNTFLETVSLMTNEENESSEDKNKVTLMTIHSSKGLEFRNVYIVGVEEKLFPSELATLAPKEIEEERRLFYVAITRAEKNLFISYAKSRYKWGQLNDCIPSRFIREINPVFVESAEIQDVEESDEDFLGFSINKNFGSSNSKKFAVNQPIKQIPKISVQDPILGANKKLTKVENTTKQSSTNNNSDSYEMLKIGTLVQHSRFGKGTILELEGELQNTKATIDFVVEGKKQLLLKFAKLEIIG